ncbi:hypothetical protein ACFVKB_48315 [Rhodococcus sp. NPDC127530]|uniref:hypothetical protein n=1 Tax=unclassified Rhodococcus (in: high G+C Gram-positive bacteria) TaxID=192944 RepID=UPI0036386032
MPREPAFDRWPIQDSEIIEFQLETNATEATAFIGVLRATLSELLAGRAKWQIIGPRPLDLDDATAGGTETDRQRPDVVISIGVRGEGDAGTIEDTLYRALREAGLRIGPIFVAGYPFGIERAQVLAKYTELNDASDR